MADFRYSPRSFTLDPLDFGKRADIRWRSTEEFDDREVDQLVASRFQHQCAVEVRARIAQRYPSLSEFADLAGLKYERLARVLRGEVIMRLEDVAMAQRLLGFQGLARW
ncbi:hypothetical protein FVA74_13365 [Salinibacterium sp. dk2585]|uniref:hypothetical protein n=1 Tax=unclassified Salinibacterium TaxID=2632331 RepID=UPI0011C24AA4|nr:MULTISPECIES: hypothetical protein [unclassified Salinibacterium]QEE62450.1 hypothetical protein FVA74_13365 [Salinibacterium sp. dk2585]TXK55165.1 hypothetical protein FVP63_00015 [Salinibacterium sp. dk5596]